MNRVVSSATMRFAKHSNQAVAFGLTASGNSLVLVSGKMHVDLEPRVLYIRVSIQ